MQYALANETLQIDLALGLCTMRQKSEPALRDLVSFLRDRTAANEASHASRYDNPRLKITPEVLRRREELSLSEDARQTTATVKSKNISKGA